MDQTPLKILYIITQADGGGAQNYVLALASAFQGRVAAGTEAERLFAQAKERGLLTFPLKYLKRSINPLFDLLAVWEIWQLVRDIRPAIVHVNSTKAGVLGSIAAKLARAKVVYTAHGFVFNEPLSSAVKGFYIIAEKFASYFRDHIITVSEQDRLSALQHNLAPEEKLTTVYNGLPPIEFLERQQARMALGMADGSLYLGTIANLYATKGLDTYLHALKEVKNMFLDTRAIIFGQGPEKQHLDTLINELGLKDTVEIVSGVPDAAKYLKAFDIFVMPSRKEGFPFAILAAMQAGLPIVATNVGGIPEALEGAGLLVPPENPSALSTQITSLLLEYKMQNGSSKLQELSQKALTRSQYFIQEKMLSETSAIYQKLPL